MRISDWSSDVCSSDLCAFAPNIWWLVCFRIIASLGIGGEWAAGAAMVAEVMPEKRRVEAGALLYTSAVFGTTLATLLNLQIAGRWLSTSRKTHGVTCFCVD